MIVMPRCSCSGSLNCSDTVKRDTPCGVLRTIIQVLKGLQPPDLRFRKIYFVFLLNVTYDSPSSIYSHGVRLVALLESLITYTCKVHRACRPQLQPQNERCQLIKEHMSPGEITGEHFQSLHSVVLSLIWLHSLVCQIHNKCHN